MQTRRRTKGIEWAVGLLGVEIGADEGEVRRAFRDKVRSLHPDHGHRGTVDIGDLVAAKDLLVAVAPPAPSPVTPLVPTEADVVIDLRDPVAARPSLVDRIEPTDRRGRLIDLAG